VGAADIANSSDFSRSFIVWLAMRREVGCFALLALAVLLSLAFAACTFGEGGENATSAPAATTSAATVPQRAFVRTCEMSVYGTLDDPAWEKHSIVAGPLVFYDADQYAEQPASLFAPVPAQNGHYAGQKLLVLVRRGAVATVAVSETERRHAALLYNPADWNNRNEYRIGDGESAVTFKACKKGETAPVGGPLNAMTQFNGAFVVAGVRCLPLEIRVRGQQQTIPVTLSFGAGRCA
jgi:hypothetical protein